MSPNQSRLRLDDLLPLVYTQLREYASRMLNEEKNGISLQTSDLVHEVYLRLSQLEEISWDNDRDVMRAAVGVMRRILVDHARARKAAKRTPTDMRLMIPIESVPDQNSSAMGPDILDLDEALHRLEAVDRRMAEIVELRYLGGFSVEEVARLLRISAPTVKRDWALAKAWLYRELKDESISSP
jgi:RNA polymerase sigma-70 factor, ECF subfamily